MTAKKPLGEVLMHKLTKVNKTFQPCLEKLIAPKEHIDCLHPVNNVRKRDYMDSWANARRELYLGRRGVRQMMGVRLGVHGRWGARSGHWGIRCSRVRHAAPNDCESLPGHSQSSLMILPSLKEFSLSSPKKSQIHQTLISLLETQTGFYAPCKRGFHSFHRSDAFSKIYSAFTKWYTFWQIVSLYKETLWASGASLIDWEICEINESSRWMLFNRNIMGDTHVNHIQYFKFSSSHIENNFFN